MQDMNLSSLTNASVRLRSCLFQCVFKSMFFCCQRNYINRFASTLPWKKLNAKRSKTIELHVVTWVELCAYYKHRHLRPFSTVHTNTICMSFCFCPISRAFSNRWVVDANPQGISLDGRPTRSEMYPFSDQVSFITSNCVQFQNCLKNTQGITFTRLTNYKPATSSFCSRRGGHHQSANCISGPYLCWNEFSP